MVESPAALADCELIVIATPVQMVPRCHRRVVDASVTALVTDTGSTKRAVMAAAQSAQD